MMTQQEKNQIMSKIIKLELELTRAIINGHKCTGDDIFKEHRDELSVLRCLYYGYNSKFCKIKKGFNETPFS